MSIISIYNWWTSPPKQNIYLLFIGNRSTVDNQSSNCQHKSLIAYLTSKKINEILWKANENITTDKQNIEINLENERIRVN